MPLCECGRPMRSGADGCPRCRRLDGRFPLEADLISTLRTLGGCATYAALETEVEAMPRSIRRTIRRLAAEGRLRTFDESDDGGPRVLYVALPEYCAGPGGES